MDDLPARVDVVTAIECVQNLNEAGVRNFLTKTALITSFVIITISNRNSLHGLWTAYRGFQKAFLHTHTSDHIDPLLDELDISVTYCRGIGPDFRFGCGTVSPGQVGAP